MYCKDQKIFKENPKESRFTFYIVQSNVALYDEKTDTKKFYQLKKILKSWDQLEKYNKAVHDYSALASSIQHLVYMELENPKLNSKNSNYLHLQLAEVFLDTTAYFRNKYQISNPKALIEEKTVINMDSLFFLGEKRTQLAQSAIKQIGVPYKYGGSDSTGFDCSGFTQYVYKSIGIELPHNAQLQSELGALIRLEEAQTGDLIFFGERRTAHAAMIYINQMGKPELIHCVSRGVSHDTEKDNNHIYWMSRPYKVKSFIYTQTN